MRTLALFIAYDGSAFHGWQSQPAPLRTVQDELTKILRRVLKHPLHVTGASRTDTGVHALRQVASVQTASPIPPENLRRALGDRLPADISLVHACEARADFDPIQHAVEKLYRYRIWNSHAKPIESGPARPAWRFWYDLDLDRMRAAAADLCGTHDFAGFASAGSPRASTVRTIRRAAVDRRFEEVSVDFIGDGFLYQQVRNMVGTLVEIGRGLWPVERVREVLASRDRTLASGPAPSCGLTLQWIRYPRGSFEVSPGPALLPGAAISGDDE